MSLLLTCGHLTLYNYFIAPIHLSILPTMHPFIHLSVYPFIDTITQKYLLNASCKPELAKQDTGFGELIV